MKAFISMLRGINVGGQKTIRMEELRSLYEELGFDHIRTYVQSGNVVFNSAEQEAAKLAKRIEEHIKQSYGFSVPVFMREAHDLERILANNPFLKGRNEDPSKLHVSFLYKAPEGIDWSNLNIQHDEADEFSIGEQEIYLFCPNGYGKSKLSNTMFERKLNMLLTTRNWNTVNALYSMAVER
jgi:uncharacterized protein (DUF1697 family)